MSANNKLTLRHLLKQQAETRPGAAAIRAPNSVSALTYQQLETLCDEIGRTLRKAGIRRQDAVAVVLPSGPEMAAAFISVAAACICAPLNPHYRESEFHFYCSDLDVRGVIVLAGETAPARDAAQVLKIPIFELAPVADGPPGAFTLNGFSRSSPVEDSPAQPDDVALVLHTSGTTARPKIVPLSQANLCCSARNISQTLQLTPGDCCLNVMPLFHIHGLIGAVLSSLSAGASVACCPPFDAGKFFEWWSAINPTWYTAVPTIHQAILAQFDQAGQKPDTSALRLVRSSSSPLPPAVMQRLEEVFGVPVLESYGMTEAAHQMASNPLPPRTRKPGSVGLPAGPEMAIMNDAGELLAPGSIGEIVIRGENVTAGYANNPSANAAAFTDGWFRTGDQGRQDEDGYFHISGRLKELINRGGEKVAPREVDEVLLEFPGIAQAVTFAVPHPRLGEDVVAAVVLRPGAQVTEFDLRNYALSRLAACKVPSRVLFIDEIPKGGTGKVQRIGLHEKLNDRLTTSFAAPESDAELALADMWREVLEQGRIGIDDNFFYLGGDSLLAARLINRIAGGLDIEFSLSDMFQAPTIRSQAILIERRLIDQIAGSTE